MNRLADRLAATRHALDRAARASDRAAESVRLVVVTKSAPPSVFAELAELGVADLGENRVQGAAERLAGWRTAFRWHFIGSLQANKVRKALPLFDVFHGVDSIELMQRIDRVAGELGVAPELFLQVNVSGEASKHGLAPESLPAALEAAAVLQHARVRGLMTMAPRSDDPELARPHFAALAALARRLGPPGAAVELSELSMGMSQDHLVAVQEGATLVRIGRHLTEPSSLA
ncbi:MAG: YggS family pyridoxal phosphate enzyme [Planctomycetota bacterium]|nr:MAG: YggS family pyridoxal phosphate enzyme [Planctomycetota bacterium]